MSTKWKIILALAIVIALGAAISTAMIWTKLRSLSSAAQPEEKNNEMVSLVSEVGQSVILPEGETPNLLTVSDLESVKGQPFFANALLGDKVLVYATAGKAILWRPSIKKIVEVYPINLSPKN